MTKGIGTLAFGAPELFDVDDEESDDEDDSEEEAESEDEDKRRKRSMTPVSMFFRQGRHYSN